MEEKNDILKHALLAIGYRFKKAIANSNENFGNFKISEHTRTPNQIINHLFDLVNKTKSKILEGHFNVSAPSELDFIGETNRFLESLEELAQLFTQVQMEMEEAKKLLQGPILDITSHIGQIAMLNGLNGNKIPKENYYSANLS